MTEKATKSSRSTSSTASRRRRGAPRRPVRRRLGITAFGTNAYTADAGNSVVEEHHEEERPRGAVLRGERPRDVRPRRRGDRRSGRHVHPRGAGHEARRGRGGGRTRPSSRSAAKPGEPHEIRRGRDLRRLRASTGASDTARRASAWRRVLAEHPDAWQGSLQRGLSRGARRRRDAAVEHLRRAIELDPKAREYAARTATSTGCATTRGSRSSSREPRTSASSRSGCPTGSSGRWCGRTSASRRSASTHTSPRRGGPDRRGARRVGSSEHEELYFVLERPGDLHGQRRRDRRSRGHARLRPRPRREARRGRADRGRPRCSPSAASRARRTTVSPWERKSSGSPHVADERLGQGRRDVRAVSTERPGDAGFLYNLACAESRAGPEAERGARRISAQAVEAERAIQARTPTDDPDFDAIRDDPEFSARSPGSRTAGASSVAPAPGRPPAARRA